MEFIALDVETANPDLASICQIGLVTFCDSQVVEEWETFVDPQDDFDSCNVAVHGITEAHVAGSPTYTEVANILAAKLSGKVVVHHGSFDRTAITQASQLHDILPPSCTWLDTTRVVRRAWKECSQRDFGLAPVARMLGLTFQHHRAVEDARTAGEILLQAVNHTGLTLEDWQARVKKPIDEQAHIIAQSGRLEGPLHGEVVVFTGALSIPRAEAARLAAEAGCDVAEGVTKHTTLLVVGDQDVRKLAGRAKSSKHIKTESLIAKGSAIRILRESDFRAMIIT
jgi:DNA polymerase III subunit epsilon